MFMICTLHSDTSNLCTHEMIWSKAYNCNHPFRVNHVSLVRFDIFIFWQYTCKLWTFCSKFEDYIPFYLIGKKNLDKPAFCWIPTLKLKLKQSENIRKSTNTSHFSSSSSKTSFASISFKQSINNIQVSRKRIWVLISFIIR